MANRIALEEVVENYVMHVQRRIFQVMGEDGVQWNGVHSPPPITNTGGSLDTILFQPIAGDGARASASTKINELLFSWCVKTADSGTIKGLQFGMLDTETIERMAVVLITNPLCTEQPGCLTDLRMGASAVANRNCDTCHESHHNCPGHFGRIDLPYPVINPLFVNLLVNVMQTLCVNCHRLRLSPWYLHATEPIPNKASGVFLLQRLKQIATLCARQNRCQFCSADLLVFISRSSCVKRTSDRPTRGTMVSSNRGSLSWPGRCHRRVRGVEY